MTNVVVFPCIKRVRAINAEMPIKERLMLRRLVGHYTFLQTHDNITSIVDVRKEQFMNTLGW